MFTLIFQILLIFGLNLLVDKVKSKPSTKRYVSVVFAGIITIILIPLINVQSSFFSADENSLVSIVARIFGSCFGIYYIFWGIRRIYKNSRNLTDKTISTEVSDFKKEEVKYTGPILTKKTKIIFVIIIILIFAIYSILIGLEDKNQNKSSFNQVQTNQKDESIINTVDVAKLYKDGDGFFLSILTGNSSTCVWTYAGGNAAIPYSKNTYAETASEYHQIVFPLDEIDSYFDFKVSCVDDFGNVYLGKFPQL